MGPAEYLKILRRLWPVVVAAVLLAAGLAWVTTPEPDQGAVVEPGTVYTAEHTLLREIADEGSAPVSIDRVALFATTGEVPRRVIDRLGLDEDPAVVASEVVVAGDSDVGTITFTVTDEDPERAAVLANTFADETLAYFDAQAEEDRQVELERMNETVEDLEARAREYDTELSRLPEDSVEAEFARSQRDALIRQYGMAFDSYQGLLSDGTATIGYVTLEEASPVPQQQEGFQPPSELRPRLALGAGIGLVLGIALILVVDRTDTRVRTRRGAERAFGLPVVAEVPRLPRRIRREKQIVTIVEPASFAAEAYRILRLSLQLMPRWILPPRSPSTGDEVSGTSLTAVAADRAPRQEDDATRIVLLTSAGPRDGKTVTAANLAASYAEGGKSVVVLDCDLHGGDLHDYLGCKPSPGVADFLDSTDSSLEPLAQPTSIPGVRLVAHGSLGGNPGELMGSGRRLLQAAAQLADVVIVDSGPILAVNDPGALIPDVDVVVVVCRSGRSSAEAARLTTELLSRLEAPVLGVTLTGVTEGPFGSSSGSHSSSRQERAPGEVSAGQTTADE